MGQAQVGCRRMRAYMSPSLTHSFPDTSTADSTRCSSKTARCSSQPTTHACSASRASPRASSPRSSSRNSTWCTAHRGRPPTRTGRASSAGCLKSASVSAAAWAGTSRARRRVAGSCRFARTARTRSRCSRGAIGISTLWIWCVGAGGEEETGAGPELELMPAPTRPAAQDQRVCAPVQGHLRVRGPDRPRRRRHSPLGRARARDCACHAAACGGECEAGWRGVRVCAGRELTPPVSTARGQQFFSWCLCLDPGWLMRCDTAVPQRRRRRV